MSDELIKRAARAVCPCGMRADAKHEPETSQECAWTHDLVRALSGKGYITDLHVVLNSATGHPTEARIYRNGRPIFCGFDLMHQATR